ncbi:MAG TPA: UDP-2,3-diacylglucosamine diphosphatase [Terriglobales bacterium]|nr:UDP-2,3-diacylglucosamine diphosphatase [Terriglobales bacterium]
MSSAVYDTLILSDVHLGSELSRAEDATRMLKQNRFRRLILLGDIFSDLNFRRLTKDHWKFLSYIRKLSNPKRGVEVVWVEGNHDQGLTEVMSHLVGVKVYQEYAWEFDGRGHLAIHGHQFDRFLVNNWLLSSVNTFIHLQIQKLDFKGKWFSRFVDRMGTHWLRLSEKVASGAIFHARLRHAQRIFCGHTHVAMRREQESIEYYNSGSWTDSQLTYLTVDQEGVRIHEYQAQPEQASAGEGQKPMSGQAELAGEFDLVEDTEYENIGS